MTPTSEEAAALVARLETVVGVICKGNDETDGHAFEDCSLAKEAADMIRALMAGPKVRELVRAGDWLSTCAQTTGGTAGRDEDLVAAIDGWKAARAALVWPGDAP